MATAEQTYRTARHNACIDFLQAMIFGALQAESAVKPSMNSPCLKLNETGELTLRIEEEGRLASKASHAGIIRIGF
jgi:hypothetical protein